MSNRIPVHADAFCAVHPEEVVEENGLCQHCNEEISHLLAEHHDPFQEVLGG